MAESKKRQVKVVAHLRDHKLVRGYIENTPLGYAGHLDEESAGPLPDPIVVRRADGDGVVRLSLNSLKALFFVKSFQGRSDYREIKFFEKSPEIEGLWIRVAFYDNEVSEGIVHNSLHFLRNTGFFMKPPDPESNNRALYVLKDSLREFRVLGLVAGKQ